jgi:hypothetical protein
MCSFICAVLRGHVRRADVVSLQPMETAPHRSEATGSHVALASLRCAASERFPGTQRPARFSTSLRGC